MSSTLVRTPSDSRLCPHDRTSDRASAARLHRVLFVDHPTVPGGSQQRRYVYGRLLEYARTHPGRQLRLRPPHRLGDRGLPRMLHHPESLLADVELPINVGITHAPVAELLADTDLLLTVSSPACVAALRGGCRVAVPLDVGVEEQLAAPDSATGGLLRTFDQITADDLGTPDPGWLAERLLRPDALALASSTSTTGSAPFGWRRLAAMLAG